METQTLINIGLGIILSGVGWFARELWGVVKELQQSVHIIEVDLPKNYVQKSEFINAFKEVKEMLGKIFDKLDGKADK